MKIKDVNEKVNSKLCVVGDFVLPVTGPRISTRNKKINRKC